MKNDREKMRAELVLKAYENKRRNGTFAYYPKKKT